MKFRFLFLLIILTKVSVSFAINERRTMILLDSEGLEKKGEVSSVNLRELLKGLYDQCFPIIMSKSIWDNFTGRRRAMEMIILNEEVGNKQDTILNQAISNINNILLEIQKDIGAAVGVNFDDQGNLQKLEDPLKKKITSRIAKVETIEDAIRKSEYKLSDIPDTIVCYLTPFDEKEWIIKLYENDLVILVPRQYYEQCKQSQTEDFKKLVQQFITVGKASLTMDELILGIKIDHLKTIDKPLDSTNGGTSVDFSIIKAFNDIFITRSDLGLIAIKTKGNDDKYEQLLHPWYVIISGHGSSTSIVDLPLMKFKEVLQFFNIQIFTRFLFYNSCLSGGANVQQVFEYGQAKGREIAEDAVQWIQEEFNYTIAGGTLLDASTYTPSFYLDSLSIRRHKGKIIVMPGQRQKTDTCRFFEQLSLYFGDSISTMPPASIANIINYVHPFNIKEAMYYRYYNTPMIRFAHTPWFFVDKADKEVMHITPIKVKIATANKQPIIIKDKKVVFLADPFIPLTIIIEGQMPTFLFAVAGDVNIHIDSIKVDILLKQTINNFLKSFLLVDNYAYTKSCTIKKLALGRRAFQMFQHILIKNNNIGGYVAYAERMDGVFFILTKSKGEPEVEEIIRQEESAKPEHEEKLKMYADEYKQLAPTEDVSAPTPEIEEGIEYQSLEEYSAEPVAQLLQKRIEKKKADEFRKKLFEQAWQQYVQKKQQEPPQAKFKIEELD